ncbi:MAG: hypothetical protein OEP52_12235 [Acidimicrobiia bacterium]|nr:hypothetical protein [Acidimicrobiia bacterium]
MTQEFERKRRQEAYQGTVDLPPREPLSVDAVETIIRRAVELQVDDDLALPTLDEKALHRVAEELGIEPGHLRRAIAEARTALERPEHSVFDRLFAPGSITESAIVYADRETVESRLGEWMSKHEGLRLRRKLADGGVWEKDSHVLTRIRMGLRMGRGSRVLRNSRKVSHRIQAIKDEEQALALEAETHTLKAVGAAAVAGLGAVAAAGAAFGSAVGAPEIAIPAATGGFLLGSGAIVMGVKVWLSRVKDALRRALDAVSSPDVMKGGDPLERQLMRLRRNFKEAREDFRGRNRWM